MKEKEAIRKLEEAFEVVNELKGKRDFSFDNKEFKEVSDRIMKCLSRLQGTQLYTILPMQEALPGEIPGLEHQRGGFMYSHGILTISYGFFFKKELVFDPLLGTWFKMKHYPEAAYKDMSKVGLFPIKNKEKWRK